MNDRKAAAILESCDGIISDVIISPLKKKRGPDKQARKCRIISELAPPEPTGAFVRAAEGLNFGVEHGFKYIILFFDSTYLLFCADEISYSNSTSPAASMDYITVNAPIQENPDYPPAITGPRPLTVGHRNKRAASGKYVLTPL
jgi:hypothetical protein